MYPRRYGGMAMSRPDQYNLDPRIYPNQPDMRQMNPPGYTVTGRIVYDWLTLLLCLYWLYEVTECK